MISIEKYHGTGNDFVVVSADETVPDRRSFAVEVCDRASGVSHPESDRTGADGVLFLELDPDSRPPRVTMHLIQPDGSVAGMCGNGARCAADWAARQTGADEVRIETPAGTRRAWISDGGATVEMGQPTFDPDRVPVDAADPIVEREIEGLTVTAVNTGVPHAVAFVDEIAAVDLVEIGPAVRSADVFPSGTNVTLAAPNGTDDQGDVGDVGDVGNVGDVGDEDDASDEAGVPGFAQRTFERGVEAETHSCGTGAVAVVAVARRLGRVDDGRTVRVSPPGGDLEVTLTDDGSLLRGPVVREYSDTIPADRFAPGDPQTANDPEEPG